MLVVADDADDALVIAASRQMRNLHDVSRLFLTAPVTDRFPVGEAGIGGWDDFIDERLPFWIGHAPPEITRVDVEELQKGHSLTRERWEDRAPIKSRHGT